VSTSFWKPSDFLLAALKLSTEKLKFLMKLVKVKNQWTSVDDTEKVYWLCIPATVPKKKELLVLHWKLPHARSRPIDKVSQRSPRYKKNPIAKISGSSGIPVLKSFKPKEEKEAAPFYPSVVRRER